MRNWNGNGSQSKGLSVRSRFMSLDTMCALMAASSICEVGHIQIDGCNRGGHGYSQACCEAPSKRHEPADHAYNDDRPSYNHTATQCYNPQASLPLIFSNTQEQRERQRSQPGQMEQRYNEALRRKQYAEDESIRNVRPMGSRHYCRLCYHACIRIPRTYIRHNMISSSGVLVCLDEGNRKYQYLYCTGMQRCQCRRSDR